MSKNFIIQPHIPSGTFRNNVDYDKMNVVPFQVFIDEEKPDDKFVISANDDVYNVLLFGGETCIIGSEIMTSNPSFSTFTDISDHHGLITGIKLTDNNTLRHIHLDLSYGNVNDPFPTMVDDISLSIVWQGNNFATDFKRIKLVDISGTNSFTYGENAKFNLLKHTFTWNFPEPIQDVDISNNQIIFFQTGTNTYDVNSTKTFWDKRWALEIGSISYFDNFNIITEISNNNITEDPNGTLTVEPGLIEDNFPEEDGDIIDFIDQFLNEPDINERTTTTLPETIGIENDIFKDDSPVLLTNDTVIDFRLVRFQTALKPLANVNDNVQLINIYGNSVTITRLSTENYSIVRDDGITSEVSRNPDIIFSYKALRFTIGNKIADTTQGSVIGISGETVGGIAAKCVQEFTFNTGYTWFSIYKDIITDISSIVQNAVEGQEVTKYNSGTVESSTFTNGSWTVPTFVIDPSNSYVMRIPASSGTSLAVIDHFERLSYDIPINPGWNWIPYPSKQTKLVTDIIVDPSNNDIISSQTATSSFTNITTFTNKWTNPQFQFEPHIGYRYFSNASTSKTITIVLHDDSII